MEKKRKKKKKKSKKKGLKPKKRGGGGGVTIWQHITRIFLANTCTAIPDNFTFNTQVNCKI